MAPPMNAPVPPQSFDGVQQVAAPSPKYDEVKMATKAKTTAKVPAAPPVRVEIRVNGRVRFANNCYETAISEDGDTVTFTAALKPTMVDAQPPAASFGDDIRDGDHVIQQVHSGRRT